MDFVDPYKVHLHCSSCSKNFFFFFFFFPKIEPQLLVRGVWWDGEGASFE